MKKRLIGLIVALATAAFYTIPAWAEMAPIPEWILKDIDNKNVHSDLAFEENKEFFKYLGYVSGKEMADDAVLRGYAVDVLTKIYTSVMQEPEKQDFTDIPLSSEYAVSVHTALVNGLIQKTDTKFYPKDKATLAECGKIALNILGYSQIVGLDEYKCIKDLKLYKNIDTSKKNLSMADFYTFIKNMLMADVAVIKLNSNGYEVEKLDKTLLEYKKDIKKTDGIITANDFSAIYDKDRFREGYIELNKMEYEALYPVGEELLGKYSSVYIDESQGYNTVVCVMEDEGRNNELVIEGDDISGFAGYTLSYYLEKTLKKANIAKDAAAIYNGQYKCAIDEADGLFDRADTVRLVDNNRDNRYDVVFIEKKEYAFVNYVSPESETIKIFNGSNIELSEEKCASYKLYNDSGEKLDITDIQSKSVLEIKKGTRRDLRSVYEILVSSRKITGSVKQILSDNGKRYYAINDVAFESAYELSEYYEKFLREDTKSFKPELGSNATFYVSTDKKIVYSETVTYSYGFVTKCIIDDIDENICDLVLFTFDKGHETLRLKDKLTFITPDYASGVKIDAADAVERMKENGKVANKMIAYQVNQNGEITKLATEYDMTGKKPVKTNYPLVKNFVVGGEGYKTDENRVYYNVIGRKYYLPTAASKISIPRNPERYIKADEFSKGVMGTLSDVYLSEQRVSVYNSSEFYVAGFCVEERGAAGTVDWLSKPVMIKDVSRGLGPDDEEGVIIKYYLGGVEAETFVPEEVRLSSGDYYGVHGTGAELEKGDIIQLSKDSDGNADTVNIIMKADNRGMYRTQGENGVEKVTPFTGTGVIYGVVEDITTDNGGAFILNVSDSGKDPEPVVSAFVSTAPQYGQNTYTLMQGKKVTKIQFTDIEPGDVVFAVQRYALVTDIFVFR